MYFCLCHFKSINHKPNMKTKTISTIALNLMLLILITSCDNDSAPLCPTNPPDQEINNDIIQDFIDAGFKIVTPHDSLPPPKRFSSSLEASRYLEQIKAEQESIANIKNTSRAVSHVDLKFDRVGDHYLYYFKYKGLYVEINGGKGLTNDHSIIEEKIHILFNGTALPTTKHEDFVSYCFVYHSQGYNHITITITSKRTVEINGVTLYQNQQIVGLICTIDFEKSIVRISERDI